jgi:hypothetical protein
LHLIFTHGAFQTQDNFLGCLSLLIIECSSIHRQDLAKSQTHLLVKNRLGLSTITRLFAIVPTFPLSSKRIFTLLVLCHFVRAASEDTRLMRMGRGKQRHDIRVLPAILMRAVCRKHYNQLSPLRAFWTNSHVRRVLRSGCSQLWLSDRVQFR